MRASLPVRTRPADSRRHALLGQTGPGRLTLDTLVLLANLLGWGLVLYLWVEIFADLF